MLWHEDETEEDALKEMLGTDNSHTVRAHSLARHTPYLVAVAPCPIVLRGEKPAEARMSMPTRTPLTGV